MKLSKVKNYTLLSLGFVSVILAIIGLFLPILPTTPFLILAAFLFSKSSKKIHDWLLNHKIFGPVIYDWERYGAISVKTKWISSISLITLFSYTIYTVEVNDLIKAIVALSGLSIFTFINTRPSR